MVRPEDPGREGALHCYHLSRRPCVEPH
ncbi:hypothetical protein E2C01_076048 [Portunus trituberculatus]|uniref:Uncharacterized protein n=1 Tax=Portunus trituberculatus TaxID=210409 RepID=A0A5B7IC79_PORTR|nr:hypothetical protein [Portunus trituberculatus]